MVGEYTKSETQTQDWSHSPRWHFSRASEPELCRSPWMFYFCSNYSILPVLCPSDALLKPRSLCADRAPRCDLLSDK